MSGARVVPPVFGVPAAAPQSVVTAVVLEPPPPSAAEAVQSVAVRELLGFDPRLIAQLPLATTLLCRQKGAAGAWVVTTSRSAYEGVRARGVPTFVGGELLALVRAAENDRASSDVLAQWCARKVEDHAWRLSDEFALNGIFDAVEPQGWLLGQVLRRYGTELVAVGCGDEVPA